ncbi:MAG TPA: tripartite tricarboxylate transporter TctB family protein [Clostridia bacterium]|nr:tripartite tricarboxylate transporter TctB family protein [Clostridia bacterium]
MKNVKPDMIFLLLLMLISVPLYMQSRQFPMGADVFPKLLLVVILILSVYEFVRLLGSKEQDQEQAARKGWQEKYNPVVVFAFCVIYAVCIKIIGFFTSTVVFVAATMWYLGVREIKTYVISIAGIGLFIYLLFVMQLKVPLPKGLLF